MSDLRTAAQQALEALEESEQHYGSDSALRGAIQILRAALEQPEQEDFAADAHRLAMELECLLLSTKDTAALSRWWDSAHDALDQHRQLVKEAYGEPIEKTSGSPLRCRKCGGSIPVSYDETRTGQCNCMEHARPPRREWRGLTEEENNELSHTMVKGHKSVNWLARAIEQLLKERNQ
jgi:hypothetical protein